MATLTVMGMALTTARPALAAGRESTSAGCWQRVSAPALTDVEIGANGAIWALGQLEPGLGWPVIQWTGSAWVPTGRYGLAVAVSPVGWPWYIDMEQRIFRLVSGVWEQLPGAATSIDIGAEGSVWITGNVQLNDDGYGIYRWIGDGWQQIDGAAAAVNVDRSGQPWIMTFWPTGEIFRRFGNSWIQTGPVVAWWDLGIGGGDAVWRVVYTPSRGQNSLERWTGFSWERTEGAGDRVSVDGLGRAWHVNGLGQVFYWTCG